jgi:hypothetical protein
LKVFYFFFLFIFYFIFIILKGAVDLVYLSSADQNELETLNSEFVQNFKPFPYSMRTELLRNQTFAKTVWEKIDQIISPFEK